MLYTKMDQRYYASLKSRYDMPTSCVYYNMLRYLSSDFALPGKAGMLSLGDASSMHGMMTRHVMDHVTYEPSWHAGCMWNAAWYALWHVTLKGIQQITDETCTM